MTFVTEAQTSGIGSDSCLLVVTDMGYKATWLNLVSAALTQLCSFQKAPSELGLLAGMTQARMTVHTGIQLGREKARSARKAGKSDSSLSASWSCPSEAAHNCLTLGIGLNP